MWYAFKYQSNDVDIFDIVNAMMPDIANFAP